MVSSTRFPLIIVLGAALAGSAGSTAHAQGSAAEKADQLNAEGKQLFGAKDFPAAAAKFKEAILFNPEGRFYFNLCYTLNKMGQYRDAITACENVSKYQASNPLKEKASKLLEALREHVKNTSQDPDLNPGSGGGDTGGGDTGGGDTGGGDTGGGDTGGGDTGGGDTGGGDTGGGDTGGGDTGGGDTGGGTTGATGPPPPPPGGVVEAPAAPPLGDYKWSVGGEFGFVINGLGDPDLYSSTGGLFRLHADFMLPGQSNFGLSGYVQVQTMTGDADMADALQVVDLGGALFQHLRINNNLWWTWLGGLHIAVISPNDIGEDGIATFGGRGDVSVHYLLGSRGQHVLTAGVALNVYLPSQQDTSSVDPELFGLDSAGATFNVGIGYTMRFDQPFGSAPVFTLE